MKKTAVSLALMGLLALGGQAVATICTIDQVPAATLLLPYFEVDLSNPNGLTTLFSVNNASEEAALVHVVIWSDLSVPVLDFDIYLTGYDVQTVNLRDIIINGVVPKTADVQDDAGDTISPEGLFSDDISFPNCSGSLPPPALPSFYITHLQNALTGKPSTVLGGLCAGQAIGDNIARGYITMDSVNRCSINFPGDSGYFVSGGTGIANNFNDLWGDWFIVNTAPNASFAQGGTLVHIEADATNPETSTSGNYTFYGRYTSPPFSAADNREPLADTFATRYLTGGSFSGGTSLLVWRDAKQAQNPFTCPATQGVRPPWYPLGQQAIVIFDEQETPSVPQTFPFSPQPPGQSITPFPAETQRTSVNTSGVITPTADAELQVPFNFGWLYLDLKTAVLGACLNPPNDSPNDIITGGTCGTAHISTQAYVIATYSTLGNPNAHFAVGVDAIKLDSACFPSAGVTIPIPGTNGPFDIIPSAVEPPGDTEPCGGDDCEIGLQPPP
jgi:hypothetical protein